MSWTTPPSFTSGNTLTAAQVNILGDDLLETVVAKVTTKGDTAFATGANALARVAVSGTKGARFVEDSSQTAGVKWQAPQDVRADRTSNQSISNAVEEAIAYNATDDFDSNALHDTSTNNSRLTAAVAGRYLIGAQVTFAANATGQRYVKIRADGSGGTVIAEARVPSNSGSTVTTINLTGMYPLAATHYVEVYVYQDSGGALNVTDSNFWMTLATIT